jgi:hypothetical protein
MATERQIIHRRLNSTWFDFHIMWSYLRYLGFEAMNQLSPL